MSQRLPLLLATLAFLPGAPAAEAARGADGPAWCGTVRGGARAALLAHAEERSRRGAVRASAASASRDAGQIAVLEDRGDLALHQNFMDLQGASFRFTPEASGFAVARLALPANAEPGRALALGDDATLVQRLPFAFPFFGRTYTEVHVNSDGNLTFGEGDGASTARNVSRLVSGPPRLAPLLADLDPSKGGTVTVREGGGRFTVSWAAVPQFERSDRNTFEVTLWPDGRVDFVYAFELVREIEEGVVGLAPGAGEGGVTGVDFATVSARTVTGALAEAFRDTAAIDTVAVARRFYESHGDDYRQLVIFTDRRFTAPGTFAFESTVQNAESGLGLTAFDQSAAFGSRGSLQSIVMMDAITKYPSDPTQAFLGEDSTLSVLAHETGHRWLAQARFRDGARDSAELLGRSQVHWSFFFDTDGSHLEGNDLEDQGGGRFRTSAAATRYSALDLYFMGLGSPDEVPPLFFVRNPVIAGEQGAGRTPAVGISFTGTRVDVAMSQVLASMGPRVPAQSSPAWRQAFVFVATGGPASAADLERVERIRAAWPAFYERSTGGRGLVDPRLE